MDISKYAAEPDSYEVLSAFQISRFFKRHGPTTRNDCDRLATNILDCPVAATPVQGADSYTVAAIGSNGAPKVVQFRSKELNIESIKLVKQFYGKFVPNCEPSSTMLGGVHVYVWDLVPGPAFCRVRRQFLSLNGGLGHRLYRTVEDFARSVVGLHATKSYLPRDFRFFAAAWNNKSTVENPLGLLEEYPLGSLDEYNDILHQVSQGLPEQLQAKLDEVRHGLPCLFRPDYPMVIQHDDLLENNIHVDEDTGHITGIVDWSDAIIAPFGVSLGGLETILGVQTRTSWHFHPNHLSLRRHFWDTLYLEIGDISDGDRRSIEVARLFGLFRAHGFEEKDQAIIYLEALYLL